MARDYNKAILLGRLAKDPEVHFTPNNQKAARFTICTGRQWKNKQTGEQQSHTDFISVTAWSSTAEVVEKYTRKGSQVLVEGRISTRDYEDKTGARRYVTEVVADNIVLLGGNGQQMPQNDAGRTRYAAEGKYIDRGNIDPAGARESAYSDNFPLDFSDLGGDVEIPF